MKKYKVAIIHNIISPYRVPLFEGLANHPYIDLFVYYCARTHKEREWDIFKSNGYTYEILSGVTLDFANITYHINPSLILELIRESYDVVIIGGSSDFTTQAAFITSELLKTPIIEWSEGISGEQSLLGKLISPLTKYFIKHASACIAASTSAKDYFITNGALPEKVFVPPNTVDTEFFKNECFKYKTEKNELKRKLCIKNIKLILYAGQLIARKGIDYLLRGYKKLKDEYDDVGLVIVGSGPLKKNIQSICKTENIQDVYFFSFVQQKELPMYYSVADLFVLPSLRETFGLVINEAMACGLPVITTRVAGAKDLISQGENGFIVNEANVDHLYLAMRDIIVNEELARKMGEKSLEIIERRYNIEQAVNGFVSAIEYACREKKMGG